MDRTAHPLAAWLGPALDDLSDEQLDRLAAESAAIDARYPDGDDDYRREAALSAAAQYILGDTRAEEFGQAYAQATLARARAYAASQQIALMLLAEGASEAGTAAATGIDRMTVRKLAGKR